MRQAVRLGRLQPGDQLPEVKDVVANLQINPNTVLKAYRELDTEGIVDSRRGRETFVSTPSEPPQLRNHQALQDALDKWVDNAHCAGLDQEAITALFATALRAVS